MEPDGKEKTHKRKPETGLLNHASLAKAHFHIWKCNFLSNKAFLLFKKKKNRKPKTVKNKAWASPEFLSLGGKELKEWGKFASGKQFSRLAGGKAGRRGIEDGEENGVGHWKEWVASFWKLSLSFKENLLSTRKIYANKCGKAKQKLIHVSQDKLPASGSSS